MLPPTAPVPLQAYLIGDSSGPRTGTWSRPFFFFSLKLIIVQWTPPNLTGSSPTFLSHTIYFVAETPTSNTTSAIPVALPFGSAIDTCSIGTSNV